MVHSLTSMTEGKHAWPPFSLENPDPNLQPHEYLRDERAAQRRFSFGYTS